MACSGSSNLEQRLQQNQSGHRVPPNLQTAPGSLAPPSPPLCAIADGALSSAGIAVCPSLQFHLLRRVYRLESALVALDRKWSQRPSKRDDGFERNGGGEMAVDRLHEQFDRLSRTLQNLIVEGQSALEMGLSPPDQQVTREIFQDAPLDKIMRSLDSESRGTTQPTFPARQRLPMRPATPENRKDASYLAFSSTPQPAPPRSPVKSSRPINYPSPFSTSNDILDFEAYHHGSRPRSISISTEKSFLVIPRRASSPESSASISNMPKVSLQDPSGSGADQDRFYPQTRLRRLKSGHGKSANVHQGHHTESWEQFARRMQRRYHHEDSREMDGNGRADGKHLQNFPRPEMPEVSASDVSLLKDPALSGSQNNFLNAGKSPLSVSTLPIKLAPLISLTFPISIFLASPVLAWVTPLAVIIIAMSAAAKKMLGWLEEISDDIVDLIMPLTVEKDLGQVRDPPKGWERRTGKQAAPKRLTVVPSRPSPTIQPYQLSPVSGRGDDRSSSPTADRPEQALPKLYHQRSVS